MALIPTRVPCRATLYFKTFDFMYQCNAVFVSLQSQHHSNLQNSTRKNEKNLFNILVVLIGSCGQPTERLFVSFNTFLFGHESCGVPVVVSGNNTSGEAPPGSSSLLVSYMASDWWEALSDSTSTSQLTKHLKPNFPSQRRIDSVINRWYYWWRGGSGRFFWNSWSHSNQMSGFGRTVLNLCKTVFGIVRSIFLVHLLRKTAAPPGYKPKQSEFLFAFSAFRHGKWSNWT